MAEQEPTPSCLENADDENLDHQVCERESPDREIPGLEAAYLISPDAGTAIHQSPERGTPRPHFFSLPREVRNTIHDHILPYQDLEM